MGRLVGVLLLKLLKLLKLLLLLNSCCYTCVCVYTFYIPIVNGLLVGNCGRGARSLQTIYIRAGGSRGIHVTSN